MRVVHRLAAVLAALIGLASQASAATLTLNRETAPPGSALVLSGSGFTANSVVDVYFDLKQVAFKVTSSTGAFTLTTKIPLTDSPGAHTITVMPHSGAGASAQKDYTVRTNWAQWRGDSRGRARNLTENTLTSSTVDDLELQWSSTQGMNRATAARYMMNSAPVVAGDNYYYVARSGNLVAYNRVSRAKVFEVAAAGNNFLPPAVSGNVVFVSGSGKLSARSAATGALIWQANLPEGVGPPVVHLSSVYVTARGTDGGLFVFSATCKTGGATCTPTWRTTDPNGDGGYYIPEPQVAVGNGKIYAKMDGTLLAYPINCATGGAVCAPVDSTTGVVTQPPTYSNGYVYTTTTTELVAYRDDGLSRAWSAALPSGSYRAVTVARNKVYVTVGATLYAFPASCSASTCAPLWSTTVGPSNAFSAMVAGNLLYVVAANDIVAFPLDCYTGCPPLWSGSGGGVFGNASYASVAVADGVVYAPGGAGGLKIYTLPPIPPSFRQRKVYMSRLRPDPTFAARTRAVELVLKRMRNG